VPKCQTFSFCDDFIDVTPGALQMRAVVGEQLSVGLVRFIAPGADALKAKDHTHGEEVSLILEGGAEVFQGAVGDEPFAHTTVSTGDVMIMPADEPHYGTNNYNTAGISMRLNVVSPPRAEFGSKGQEKVYYPTQDGTRKDG